MSKEGFPSNSGKKNSGPEQSCNLHGAGAPGTISRPLSTVDGDTNPRRKSVAGLSSSTAAHPDPGARRCLLAVARPQTSILRTADDKQASPKDGDRNRQRPRSRVRLAPRAKAADGALSSRPDDLGLVVALPGALGHGVLAEPLSTSQVSRLRDCADKYGYLVLVMDLLLIQTTISSTTTIATTTRMVVVLVPPPRAPELKASPCGPPKPRSRNPPSLVCSGMRVSESPIPSQLIPSTRSLRHDLIRACPGHCPGGRSISPSPSRRPILRILPH